VFGFIGLFYNPLLIFVAFFIYMGASAEAGQAQLRDLATGTLVSEAMITRFETLPADARIDQAVEALLRTTQHEFPVTDPSGRLTGVLTRDGLIRALREMGPETPVSVAMHPDVPTVHNSASFDEAFRLMQECGCPGVGVIDASGRLVGLLTPENVGEMMMVRTALARKTTTRQSH
jgi:stage IV sporulation protein FB